MKDEVAPRDGPQDRRRVLVESVLLVLCAPALLFPTLWPALTIVALTALGLWWLGGTVFARSPWPPSPMNGALLLWATMVGTGTLVAAYPDETLPKATNLLLGMAVWRLTVLWGTRRRSMIWLTRGLWVLGSGMTALGLVAVSWSKKVPLLQPLLTRLPAALVSLPEVAAQGVNANQFGGVLAMLLPPALAGLAWALQAYHRQRRETAAGSGREKGRRSRERPHTAVAAGLATLSTGALAGALILTQSRSSWIGAVTGILALAITAGLTSRKRAYRQATLIGTTMLVLTIVGALVIWGPKNTAALWETPGGVETSLVGTVNLSGRVEIWSRAIYAIQDFPFTGCGLGTFREVVWFLYPLFTIPQTTDIAHAHNIFLQVAVDTGLPGLIAYLALLVIAVKLALTTARTSPERRALALGLLGGLVALHVYGLTDALAPGSKPGLLFWYMLGLLGAIESDARRQERSTQPVQPSTPGVESSASQKHKQ